MCGRWTHDCHPLSIETLIQVWNPLWSRTTHAWDQWIFIFSIRTSFLISEEYFPSATRAIERDIIFFSADENETQTNLLWNKMRKKKTIGKMLHNIAARTEIPVFTMEKEWYKDSHCPPCLDRTSPGAPSHRPSPPPSWSAQTPPRVYWRSGTPHSPPRLPEQPQRHPGLQLICWQWRCQMLLHPLKQREQERLVGAKAARTPPPRTILRLCPLTERKNSRLSQAPKPIKRRPLGLGFYSDKNDRYMNLLLAARDLRAWPKNIALAHKKCMSTICVEIFAQKGELAQSSLVNLTQ